MAKKKKEEPIVDNDTGKIKVKAKKEKQPDGNETKGNVTKVKKKMKMEPKVIEETMTKINLDQPLKTKENADTEQETTDVVTDQPTETVQEVVEEIPSEQKSVQDEDTPVVEEITKEETEKETTDISEHMEDVAIESSKTKKPLPENVEKLINFIEETGGDISDYVTLNQDYSELDNHTLLKEYYRSTKPHLSEEEVDFVMEYTFAYDE